VDVVTGWWDDYFWGAMVVARVFIASLILMLVFGLIGAAAKLSDSRIAQRIGSACTVMFRGTPELLVILLIYYGSAVALTASVRLFDPDIRFVDIPPFWAGTIAISLVVGAYATETFRSAFLGVRPGSIEASRALGLSAVQTFVLVRFAEMWRLAVPAFGNHALSLIKDTALISVIGLNETLFVARQATSTTGKPFTMFLIVGAIYLAFSTLITLAIMGLEKYANRHLMAA
jgi:polar amino acid transport system permease protein